MCIPCRGVYPEESPEESGNLGWVKTFWANLFYTP
jgi:hypothetical protein